MKITFLVGLPGSGKTYLGQNLALIENAIYLDDISVRDNPIDELRLLLGAPHIVISDVFLCRKKERINATNTINRICSNEGFQYDLKWLFFENNPQKCLNNIAHRGDGRLVTELVRELSKAYEIPDDVEPITIWQN